MMNNADWKRVRFGEVVRQVKDKVDPETSGLERYIAGEHMDTDDLRIRRWGEINDDYLGPAFHMRFKPGQVLYGSRRTYLRKVAVPDFEGICANTTYVLEPKDPTVLLPELLPFIMQTERFHEHSIKQSKGSVNPYINFSDIAWYEFALPPLEEQRRFVEALTVCEDVSNLYKQLIQCSSALCKSVQEGLLLGEKERETIRLDKFMHINPREASLSEDDPFVPMEAVDEWQRSIERFERRGRRGGARARGGDILLARITPCLENGKTAQVPASIERCGGSTEFIVLRAKQDVDPDYVYWVATSPRVRHRAIGLMHGSTGRQRLVASDFASIRIPIPDLQLAAKAIVVLNSLEAESKEFLARLHSCKRIKSAILSEMTYGDRS